MSYVEIYDDLIKVKLFGVVNRFDDYTLEFLSDMKVSKIEFDFKNAETIDSYFVGLFFMLYTKGTISFDFYRVNNYCRDVLDMACVYQLVNY
ncbi:hypothetical protein MAQ5080_02550 [Marinomonas aquimarina]|uniref:STAS domain-containing protein n=1 Tax=Marinomonas aquimarina TaxID=295068 RepID=A0A1A8TI56_9GAMM|nr:hypothetical protein [Marinomonas aquimarina]SBS33324.1 hypothetical protein MAQ5080_02550 [Marinomonas aquimarina]